MVITRMLQVSRWWTRILSRISTCLLLLLRGQTKWSASLPWNLRAAAHMDTQFWRGFFLYILCHSWKSVCSSPLSYSDLFSGEQRCCLADFYILYSRRNTCAFLTMCLLHDTPGRSGDESVECVIGSRTFHEVTLTKWTLDAFCLWVPHMWNST